MPKKKPRRQKSSSGRKVVRPKAPLTSIAKRLDPAKLPPIPEDALGRAALLPAVATSLTMRKFGLADVPLESLIFELHNQCEAASKGDLTRAEQLLMSQAQTLDVMFHSMAQRAAMNMGQHMDAFETYMRLAMRAQGQCRATVEALAVIKNPPNLAFVKQANIGQQVQVNNGGPAVLSRGGEPQSQQSKLLEIKRGERMDSRTAATAGSAHSQLETVEQIDGAEDCVR